MVEEYNSRVLEFRPPFTDGMNASLVIGQPDFSSLTPSTTRSGLTFPADAAFDSSGNLWVADRGNNRVLQFRPPFTDGMNASLELGQQAGNQEFTSNNAVVIIQNQTTNPHLSNGFTNPVNLIFDSSGDLWLTDRSNNRVLEFKPPFTNGMNASLVVGQPRLDSPANTIAATQSSLWGPQGIALDSKGNLWVVDEEHNRVLEFASSSLNSNGPPASLEIGQPAGSYEFTNNTAEATSSSFVGPFGIAFDGPGNLWVSDRRDNRVLEFKPPFMDGESASVELGQSSLATAFTNSVPATNQTGFNNPLGIAFDPSGNLWVDDQLNNRALEFDSAALMTDATTTNVLDATKDVGANVSQTGGSCHQVGREATCYIVSDQTSVTGVRAYIAGVASASTINVYSSYLGSQAPAYAGSIPLQTSPTPATMIFYTVSVSGIDNGTATICVNQDAGAARSSTAEMLYFSGGSWATSQGVSKSASAICGAVPLSALSAGEAAVIAIGGEGVGAGLSSNSRSISDFQTIVMLVLVGGITLMAVLAVVSRRRRKGYPIDESGLESEDEEDGGLEEWN
ncbi:MAG: NHL repeat-containing protein [Thaumarchaeota archaeon]|nr:NHL repeat-containing protein [Nitrososphaerota archaeon]